MKHTRIHWSWVLFGVVVMAVCLLNIRTTVHADVYGKGLYSTCHYAYCPPLTQSTLPSGLKVSINLADGQTVPYNGYTITITPLNGQGASFKQATFSINGTPAATVTPDDTGTVSWFWKPVTGDATVVAIDIMDTSGQVTSYQFTIHIDTSNSPAASTTAHAPNPDGIKPAKKPTGIAALLNYAGDNLEKLSRTAARAINALPRPLAYSFPYLLFGLLALHALLLLFQMHREVHEYHILRSLLAQEKMVAESKKTFMELVSHYLRTPITIVLGGIDMLPKSPSTAPVVSQLHAVARAMGTKIESLLADTRTATEIALSQKNDTALSTTALWRQPGLFVPVILILIILVPYNYLAQHGGTLTVSQVDLIAQGITFFGLITVTYLIFRQLRLRKRDKHELDRLTTAQITSNRVRDELITSTATTLRSSITTIDMLTKQLGTSQATTFIREGQERFHDILTKCTIAASLRGSRSSNPYTQTTLGTLLNAATQPIKNHAAIQKITTRDAGTSFTVQNPDLITYALHTVLDNALTYTKDDGIVTVAVHDRQQGSIDIVVNDNGEGMPAAKLSQLFQPFYKAEGAEKFNHEGMGFSLYLDKLIMEYLGGAISLTSQKGHGTTVTFHVPIKAA